MDFFKGLSPHKLGDLAQKTTQEVDGEIKDILNAGVKIHDPNLVNKLKMPEVVGELSKVEETELGANKMRRLAELFRNTITEPNLLKGYTQTYKTIHAELQLMASTNDPEEFATIFDTFLSQNFISENEKQLSDDQKIIGAIGEYTAQTYLARLLVQKSEGNKYKPKTYREWAENVAHLEFILKDFANNGVKTVNDNFESLEITLNGVLDNTELFEDKEDDIAQIVNPEQVPARDWLEKCRELLISYEAISVIGGLSTPKVELQNLAAYLFRICVLQALIAEDDEDPAKENNLEKLILDFLLPSKDIAYLAEIGGIEGLKTSQLSEEAKMLFGKSIDDLVSEVKNLDNKLYSVKTDK